jgi:hypothetical protein
MDPQNLRERLQTIRKRLIQQRAADRFPGDSTMTAMGRRKSLTECLS